MRKVAALALQLIHKRAFPSTGASKDRFGKSVKPLSRKYKEAKTGNVRYKDARTKRAALKRRRENGHPGKGILAEGMRLGARSGEANQQLTGMLKEDFQVVRVAKSRVQLGWVTRRSQRVAAAVDKRNDFLGLTKQEEGALRDLVEKYFEEEVGKEISSIPSTGSIVLRS